MLTKEQIIELLRENPDWTPNEDATEEEMALYEEALVELGIDDDEDMDWDDDGEDDDILDMEKLDEDEDGDEDWADEDL